jgi:hypothetical protein
LYRLQTIVGSKITVQASFWAACYWDVISSTPLAVSIHMGGDKMRTSIKTNIAFSMLLFALTLTPFAHGGAVINPGFAGTNTLAANDDGSTGLVSLGFAANFFGTSYTDGYVNNNGNLTFTGGLNQFTPQGIKTVDKPMIAPFFADVDTRGEGLGLVTYGSGTLFGQTPSLWNGPMLVIIVQIRIS